MTGPRPALELDALARAAGEQMHQWARDLWPICRSLTGPGVRDTLSYLGQLMPGLKVHEVATGSSAFDWTVPDEWAVEAAWIEDADGRRIVDMANHNLHVLGYSEPVDRWLTLEELQAHLYSLPDQPDAIPYITSYYKRRWGFCMTHRQRESLAPGQYRAVIRARLEPGHLTYGELVLPGETEQTVLLSTYVCHPSMANNELSGPVVATALARWLAELPKRRLTYRIVFVPETLGALVFLSRNLDALRAQVVAGFVLTCMGDTRAVSYLPSRLGGTLADRVARHVLAHRAPDHDSYTFRDRGSDERQYCAPGIDLPVCSIMRSKYGTFPEYHTSLDDLSLVTPEGLAGGFSLVRDALRILEADGAWRTTVLGEPQLGPRGLYPTLSTKDTAAKVRAMMDTLAYADGQRDLISLAEHAGIYALDALHHLERFAEHDLVTRDPLP